MKKSSDTISLDIVIPVYNEGECIEDTLNELNKYMQKSNDKLNVNIIYDFDKDNTLPVVKRIKNKYRFKINLIKNSKGGFANALKKGFATAKSDYVMVSMADMSDDYQKLPKMIASAKKGYDIVCGSRYMKGGKLIGGLFFKQLLSRLSGVSLYYLTGLPTHDATNSYKIYRNAMLKKMKLESEVGSEIGLEILAKAYIMGYKISEIPTRWWDRTKGESKFKLFKWIPKYLKWYFYLIKKVWFYRLPVK